MSEPLITGRSDMSHAIQNDIVIGRFVKADGTVMEIRSHPVGGEASKVGKRKVPVRKDRVKPVEGHSFVADVPVFQDGKFVGIVEEEQKTASVIGGVPLSRLDLSRFKRA